MGYDAFVRCNCWEQGKTKPYPFDFSFHWDESDFPEPDVPNTEKASPYLDNEYDLAWYALREWASNACEHPDMRAVHERIANVWGMSAFRAALYGSGEQTYPTLVTELPHVNGGSASPEAAKRMIEELERFKQEAAIGRGSELIYSENGQVVMRHNPRTHPIFAWGVGTVGLLHGLDEQGFFLAPFTTQEEAAQSGYPILFNAMQLEITRDGENVVYHNLQDGTRFTLHDPVRPVPAPKNGAAVQEYISVALPAGVASRRFHVVVRDFTPGDYAFAVEALLKVCRASVETGNRIQWT